LEQEKLDKIVLVGYSFGGTIALDFSIKYLDRVPELILISSSYTSPVIHWRIPLLLPLGKAFLSFVAWILLWQKRKVYYYYRHNESLTYWKATLLGLWTMPISIDMWMLREIISVDYEKSLHKIKARTLIIQSKDDPFVSRAEILTMNSRIPDSEIAIATQDSHFIATRTQEETAKFILNFLKK
jgi:pimeloyl-ACP methyl ester carboxylesterase